MYVNATKVQDKKCAKWIPFLIALSDPLNNLCWCIYAALGSDPYLMIITGIGFVMTLYQLIRYCVYGSSSTPKSFDAEKLPETADKEISQAEHDKKVAQAEHDKKVAQAVHDKKLALQLEHEKIKQALMQALMLAQAQLAQGLIIDLQIEHEKIKQAELSQAQLAQVPNSITIVMGLYELIRYCVYRSCITPKPCGDEKLAETADKELSQAEHDKKVALQLEHEKIKQALMLVQAQLAQVELDLAELGPVTGLAQDELDIV
ncbi:hypothetical protein POM88_010365 [Heracleum sosnowskyi]|uniref:Bidirectional sugar transporter SWEET n=1 Tax=Heracleum sosnowskyi TaxID=360622 RepID=A0AAD8MZV7_9APIA|nr:hypothetical protein POM88_010365 [Heracleum sosnowskyi]